MKLSEMLAAADAEIAGERGIIGGAAAGVGRGLGQYVASQAGANEAAINRRTWGQYLTGKLSDATASAAEAVYPGAGDVARQAQAYVDPVLAYGIDRANVLAPRDQASAAGRPAEFLTRPIVRYEQQAGTAVANALPASPSVAKARIVGEDGSVNLAPFADPSYIVERGGEAAAQLGAMLLTAKVSPTSRGQLATMALQGYQQVKGPTYQESLKRMLMRGGDIEESENRAQIGSDVVAVLSGALDAIGGRGFLSTPAGDAALDVATKSLMRKIGAGAGDIGMEAIIEAAQEGIAVGGQYYAEGDPTAATDLADRTLQAGYVGGIAGAGGKALQVATQPSARARRLAELKAVRAKGPVSRTAARENKIEGTTQAERTANTDAEIQALEKEMQNAEVRNEEVRGETEVAGQAAEPAQDEVSSAIAAELARRRKSPPTQTVETPNLTMTTGGDPTRAEVDLRNRPPVTKPTLPEPTADEIARDVQAAKDMSREQYEDEYLSTIDYDEAVRLGSPPASDAETPPTSPQLAETQPLSPPAKRSTVTVSKPKGPWKRKTDEELAVIKAREQADALAASKKPLTPEQEEFLSPPTKTPKNPDPTVQGEVVDDTYYPPVRPDRFIERDGKRLRVTTTAVNEDDGWRVKHIKLHDDATGEYDWVPFPDDVARGFESYEEAEQAVAAELEKRFPQPKQIGQEIPKPATPPAVRKIITAKNPKRGEKKGVDVSPRAIAETQELPSESPPPSEQEFIGKQPWEATADELDESIKAVKKIDRDVEVEVFGEEGAKKYKAAKRTGNSAFAPYEKQKEAWAIASAMEDALPEDKQNRLFGINEPAFDIEELRAYRNAKSFGAATPEELGLELANHMATLSGEKDPATTFKGRVALAALNGAKEYAGASGWDLSDPEITEAMTRGAVKRLASQMEPADVEMMLGAFIKPNNKTPKPSGLITEQKRNTRKAKVASEAPPPEPVAQAAPEAPPAAQVEQGQVEPSGRVAGDGGDGEVAVRPAENPNATRIAAIQSELAKLQGDYEKKLAKQQRKGQGIVPPSIKADALSQITNKMDKLDAELKALTAPKRGTKKGEVVSPRAEIPAEVQPRRTPTITRGQRPAPPTPRTISVPKREQTRAAQAAPPVDAFKRTTPAKDSPERKELEEDAQRFREREREIQERKRPLETELRNTRRNAHKKRKELQSRIDVLAKQAADVYGMFRDRDSQLKEAAIEDYLESPRSPLHAAAGRSEIARIRANRAKEQAEKEPYRSSMRTSYEEEASKYHAEADREALEVGEAFRTEAKVYDADLTKDEIESVTQEAWRGFDVSTKGDPTERVAKAVERQKLARPKTLIDSAKSNLTPEQIKEYEDELASLTKRGNDWYDKQQEVIGRAKKANDEAKAVKDKAAAEQAKIAAEEAAKREVEDVQEKRQRAKFIGKEERYWKELKRRAKGVKGKVGTAEIVVNKETGETREDKAEFFLPNWAITQHRGDDNKKTFSVTHVSSGLGMVRATTETSAKEFVQLANEVGADFTAIPDTLPEGYKVDAAWGRIRRAWEKENLHELNEDERAKVPSGENVQPTNVKADMVLDSYDLGAHDDKLDTRGLESVKAMAKEVPEFAYEPVFTVDKDKNLVFRDGVTYKFAPQVFNLHPSELTDGQTVGINLEDIGLKQISGEEAVTRALKSVGFSNVRTKEMGRVHASWKGRQIHLEGKDNQWRVVDRDEVGSAGSKFAADTLKRMHFLAGDAKPAEKGSEPKTEAISEAVAEEVSKRKPQKRSERKAEEAEAKKKVMQENLRKLIDPSQANLGLDPKKVIEAVDAALAVIDYGITRFDQYVSAVVESIGEARARELSQYLEEAARQTGIEGVTSISDVLDKPPEPPAVKSAEVSEPSDDPVTSIKNEIVNELRERRGVGPLPEVAAQTQQEWLDMAESVLAQDPTRGDRITKEINKSPRNLSNTEVAVMQLHYRQLNNQLEELSERLFAAKDSGDPVESANAQTDVDAIMTALAEVEDATKAAGREWGRAGVARQITLAKDFSLAGMMRRARVANAGEALSADQQAEIAAMAKTIKELEGKLSKLEQEKADREREQRVDEGIAEDKAKAKKVGRRATLQKRAADAVAAFTKEWSSLFELGATYDPKREADKWDKIVRAAGKVVKAYVELGINSFGEFMASVKQNIGAEAADKSRDAFSAAWEDAKAKGEIPTPDVDLADLSGITRLARRIQRALVESGITRRDDVVDAVHESLQEVIPGITRRETMDALSGYGQFSPLSKDEIDQTIRDINGQLQQLAKLEDMAAGKAPAKTGPERRTPSDEERRLIQQVNEAKKRGGFAVTDPERQLKTALDAAKTATRNRIADLEQEIRAREKIVRSRTELKPDAELTALRKRRDELMEEHRNLFPKPKATDAQKIAAANRALDKAIADLEQQLKTGDVAPQKKTSPISTPELNAKRARLDALRDQRDALRALANPKMTPEERATKAYKASLTKRIADYQERIANKEFAPRPKQEPRHLSPQELKIKKQLEDVKHDFFQKAAKYRLANMSPVERAWDYAKETAHLSRAVMTSFDVSATFRQGGIASFAHPVLAAKASKEMLRAIASRQSEFDSAEKIRNDDLYQTAMTAGLSITEDEGKITRQEEAYMGRWAKKVPVVAASARAYTTFLNSIRFQLFKQMVESLGRSGQVTQDEAKVIARYVNVATGRADLGRFNQMAANLNMVFFAPRYVASRFQYLAMPFYMPFTKTSGRVKRMIAAEYARHATGVATFLGLAVALGGLLADDEDEKPTVELDPRSSDFLKIKIGETRIDPMSGLSQVVVLSTRVAFGQTKTASGEIKPLRGQDVEYGGDDTASTIGSFLRTKLAPVPGAAVDVLSGENVVGEPVTPASAATQMFVPLSIREVKDTMQARGIPAGTAISVLGLLGMGLGTYGPKTRYAAGTAEERETQFTTDLEAMEWDSPDPAYAEFLSSDQIEQVRARREERKQSVVTSAIVDAATDSSKEELKAAQQRLKDTGWSHYEAQQQLFNHYSGRRDMNWDKFRALAEVYGLEPSAARDELMGPDRDYDTEFGRWMALQDARWKQERAAKRKKKN